MEIRNAITNPAKMQKRVLGKIFSFGLGGVTWKVYLGISLMQRECVSLDMSNKSSYVYRMEEYDFSLEFWFVCKLGYT
jgi:hypothetical protein